MKVILVLLSACVIGLAFSVDSELCDEKTGAAKASCHEVTKTIQDKTKKCCWLEQETVKNGYCVLVKPSEYKDYWTQWETTHNTKVTSLDCFSKYFGTKMLLLFAFIFIL